MLTSDFQPEDGGHICHCFITSVCNSVGKNFQRGSVIDCRPGDLEFPVITSIGFSVSKLMSDYTVFACARTTADVGK